MTVVVNNSNSSVVVNVSSNSISFEINDASIPAQSQEAVKYFTVETSQSIDEAGYYIVYRSPTLTLPSAESLAGKTVDVKNAGQGTVVIQSVSFIDNENLLNIYAGDSISVFSDGKGWFIV